MANRSERRYRARWRAQRRLAVLPARAVLEALLREGEQLGISGRDTLRAWRRAGGRVRTQTFYRLRRELHRGD
jgi:hypothetical protein